MNLTVLFMALFTALLMAFMTPVSAVAQSDEAPSIIEELRANGAEVTALGNHGRLQGWWIKPVQGAAYTAYTTPSGNTVVGVLYDSNGDMITGQQLAGAGIATGHEAPVAQQPPPQEASLPATLFAATEQAFGFVLGDSGPVIHMFADPRCPYCRSHLRALEPSIDEGLLRVHVIPVGILGARSAVKAVAIAGANNPARAWSGDGAAETNQVTGARRIKANNALHARWQARGVPFTVYRKDGHIRIAYGADGDPARFWKD